jgi:hypothetical protein
LSGIGFGGHCIDCRVGVGLLLFWNCLPFLCPNL